MRNIIRPTVTVFLLSFMMSAYAAQITNNISGSLGVAENGCVLPVAFFLGLNCEFSGGPTHASELGLYPDDNIGPVNSGGFYASAAAAPGFMLSTQPGTDFAGTPLSSFLVGLPATPGDGKSPVAINGTITIDDGGDGFGDTTDTVAGTIVLGSGTRITAAGNNLAGNKTVIESWASITHTLLPTAVSSATANAAGGFDYVIGSNGFPNNITTLTESFAAEAPAQSDFPLNSPWLDVNGGSISTTVYGPIDIVSFGLKAFPANVGAETTAVIAGLTCSDVGLDPVEADTLGNPVFDTLTDCQDNLAVWSVIDPTGTDAGKLTAGFDNLVLKISTDATGEITAANAYYTIEFPIIQPSDTSWVGGTLSFTGVLAPPLPPAQAVYAITGAGNSASTLFELNRDTAAVVRTVGPTGFSSITAMDFHPLTGDLYAIAQDSSACCPLQGDLLTLDLETGAAQIVARTGAFSDIGFHPDGRLFGNGRPDGFDDRVFQIDIDSGAYTPIADFGHPHRPGISFDSLGNGRTKQSNSIYAFDPDIPSTLFLGSISGSSLLNTLEYDQNNVLLGVTSSNMVTINVSAGTQSIVGPVFNRYTALASQPVPCFVIDAIDDAFTLINDGTPADLNTLRNDECRSDQPISIVVLAGDLVPDQGGTAITDGTAVTYTPPGGLLGQESFTYTAQDAGLDGGEEPPSVDQDTATVTVTLLEDLIPEAADDNVDIQQRQTVFIDVLDNDTLGNPVNVVTIETEPANGSASVESDNMIRYSPNYNFFGLESFQYRLTDANGDTDIATVAIGVFFVSGMVQIDIMPGKEINNINLQAGGRIQIAILSVGEFFDAPALIDPFSLKFGPRGANIIGTPSVKDIDHDGDDDLLVKFLIQQTGIVCGQLNAYLFGETFEYGNIMGFDSVNTFLCRRRPITY
jgi:hypothetical protein